jgi:hypothetical protein
MPGSWGIGEGFANEPFDCKEAPRGEDKRGTTMHRLKIDGFVRNWRGKGSFDLVGSRLPALKMTES